MLARSISQGFWSHASIRVAVTNKDNRAYFSFKDKTLGFTGLSLCSLSFSATQEPRRFSGDFRNLRPQTMEERCNGEAHNFTFLSELKSWKHCLVVVSASALLQVDWVYLWTCLLNHQLLVVTRLLYFWPKPWRVSTFSVCAPYLQLGFRKTLLSAT